MKTQKYLDAEELGRDQFLHEPIVEEILNLQEVKRLRTLSKDRMIKYLATSATESLAEELFWTLDYLEVDIADFIQLLIDNQEYYE